MYWIKAKIHYTSFPVTSSRCTKSPVLFGREIIFEVLQPVWKTYLTVTDRQTDRRSTYCGINALCVAPRGKNLAGLSTTKLYLSAF